MSTRNLARTAIEGGRCGHYKSEVSDLASSERAANRAFLRLVETDPEAADDIPAPVRRPSHPCFADKLSPMYRFLDSRVGKSWKKTYAMIRERFDTRTTPGRHIVEGHLLNTIAQNGEHKLEKNGYFRYYRYFVDKTGVLRKNVNRRRFVPRKPEKPAPSLAQIAAWLGNRKVGRMGARFVWFVPTRHPQAVKAVVDQFNIVYADLDATGNVIKDPIEYPNGRYFWSPKDRVRLSTVPFRQARLLEREDEEFVLSIPDHLLEKVLRAAPANTTAKYPVRDGQVFR